MKERKLELSPLCWLEMYDACGVHVSVEYMERAQDHGRSDDQTSVDLDREKAREIVAFLGECYPGLAEDTAERALADRLAEALREFDEPCEVSSETKGGFCFTHDEHLRAGVCVTNETVRAALAAHAERRKP